MELIAGIDLGTTNSEISVMTEEGELTVVPVDGSPVLPSCVGLDREGRLIVGRTALNQLVVDPEATVTSVKRHMGEDTRLTLRDRQLSPEEVSSLILAELRRRAVEHMGQPIEKAVITVPAYFNDRQRKATVDAGTLAGLDVVRIINEPTAAAVAYESDHTGDQRILVYDLAGDIHVDIEVLRQDYEQLILPLVRRTLESVHRCLRDASMLPNAVDRILLAGGATRTPLVQRLLTEHFDKEPRHEVDPDLIVSMGAGMQAGRIAGAQTKSLLVDITPPQLRHECRGRV